MGENVVAMRSASSDPHKLQRGFQNVSSFGLLARSLHRFLQKAIPGRVFGEAFFVNGLAHQGSPSSATTSSCTNEVGTRRPSLLHIRVLGGLHRQSTSLTTCGLRPSPAARIQTNPETPGFEPLLGE